MTNTKKGKLILLSGPSGVGKGTICKRLLAEEPTIRYSVSATTRAPREGEQDGVSYYFMTEEQFLDNIRRKGFLEWMQLYGNFYGTPLFAVEQHLQEGRSVLLEIDTQGALNIMQRMPDCVSFFVLPPSLQELQRRICFRGTEDEEAIKTRMEHVAAELEQAPLYRYNIVNDDLDRALAEIKQILKQEGVLSPPDGEE